MPDSWHYSAGCTLWHKTHATLMHTPTNACQYAFNHPGKTCINGTPHQCSPMFMMLFTIQQNYDPTWPLTISVHPTAHSQHQCTTPTDAWLNCADDRSVTHIVTCLHAHQCWHHKLLMQCLPIAHCIQCLIQSSQTTCHTWFALWLAQSTFLLHI